MILVCFVLDYALSCRKRREIGRKQTLILDIMMKKSPDLGFEQSIKQEKFYDLVERVNIFEVI